MRELLQKRWVLYTAVAVVAVGVAAALITVSLTGGSSKSGSAATTDATPVRSTPAGTGATTTTTTTTTAAPEAAVPVAGAAATAALFRGIPQRLNVLGNPKAPVTMVEFADLQCPFCREYTLNALPTIVKQYVRTGKVKLVFSGMAFLGPDSETALRAAYAAGLQNRLWNVIDLLYRNQGPENSGWVTDGLLRAVGKAAAVDVGSMMAQSQSTEVQNALAASAQQAASANVNQTPTFFAGRTGQTLNHINLSSLTPAPFQQTFDALLR